jgi:hypothetical protein
MKVQASGILILIACILIGCGKSMQDVAGVYETAEIKEPQSSATYYSTTWVLDLAESGTFTLKENKLRKFREGKTHEPVPMNGSEVSGKWELDRDSVVCNWSEFYVLPTDLDEAPPSPGYRGGEFYYGLTFDLQNTGDIISQSVRGGVTTSGELGFGVVVGRESLLGEIAKLRFKRVE